MTGQMGDDRNPAVHKQMCRLRYSVLAPYRNTAVVDPNPELAPGFLSLFLPGWPFVLPNAS
ncbi:hypothetical protein GCM10010971_00460 [Silvimonas amylolytica]|uniref:Uncharacterized protein n=1 Tax=Silvimonas amylolytica TaxID=449663 RepID=A0ABQ2PFP6_9NEIS|nr:hypothetical protein GCM10010971_00460 [Silvimonas amylolytica]